MTRYLYNDTIVVALPTQRSIVSVNGEITRAPFYSVMPALGGRPVLVEASEFELSAVPTESLFLDDAAECFADTGERAPHRSLLSTDVAAAALGFTSAALV